MRYLTIRSSLCLAATLLLSVSFPAAAQTDTSALEHCDKSMGTLAVVEPQDEIIQALLRFKLSSPTGLIRMMVQKSRCFVVVERGAGMQAMMRERELAKSGGLQQGSNVGAGQLRAADFVLTPSVLFSEQNAGGVGGAVVGVASHFLGGIGGGMKTKEAQTSMLLSDTRSGVQVASAEGKAKKRDFALGALGIGESSAGAGGAYTNTNEGKVIAASFLDNYNKIIRDMRGTSSAPNVAQSSSSKIIGGTEFNEGDVLTPKIENVKIVAEPTATGKVNGLLKKGDEVVFLGEEKDGFVHIQTASLDGWVRKMLLARK